MERSTINRLSVIGLVVLSTIAVATVAPTAARAALTGVFPPAGGDENAQAHIFQLAIALLLPVGCVFLATADWTRPARLIQRLAFPAAAVIVAFALVYYIEHPH
jgi:hypothetical protein